MVFTIVRILFQLWYYYIVRKANTESRVEERSLHELMELERVQQEELHKNLQEALLGTEQNSREHMLHYLPTAKAYNDAFITGKVPHANDCFPI